MTSPLTLFTNATTSSCGTWKESAASHTPDHIPSSQPTTQHVINDEVDSSQHPFHYTTHQPDPSSIAFVTISSTPQIHEYNRYGGSLCYVPSLTYAPPVQQTEDQNHNFVAPSHTAATAAAVASYGIPKVVHERNSDEHQPMPAGAYIVRGLEQIPFNKKAIVLAFKPFDVCKVFKRRPILVKFQTCAVAKLALAQKKFMYMATTKNGPVTQAITLEAAPAAQIKGKGEKKSGEHTGIPQRIPEGMEIRVGDITVNTNECLGRGSRSTVYKGTLWGTPVAVKVLSASSSYTLNEIRLLTTLRHPDILLFFGVCFNPCPMLVFELLQCDLNQLLHEADTLPEIMRSLLPIPYMIKLKISISVARAVLYLHYYVFVVHRDIKPQNILIDERGNAKLGDMGSCRRYDHATKSISPTEKPEGTLAYLAPELLQETSTASTQADVFAFGVTLWELFYETIPFGDIATTNIKASIIRGAHPRAATVPPQFPGGFLAALEQIISLCWLPIPNQRPDIGVVIDRLTELMMEVSQQQPSHTTSSTSTSKYGSY
ncbi:Serine/threonine-protein kinase CTR1 [Pelomyxa schiedti]|nr:Serine/threonine-protein kinase CTR1 [Pelomyxa schiedti]